MPITLLPALTGPYSRVRVQDSFVPPSVAASAPPTIQRRSVRAADCSSARRATVQARRRAVPQRARAARARGPSDAARATLALADIAWRV